MRDRITVPTIEGIRSGLVTESQRYEFKARLNLDEQRGKSNFIDDVVAFLNAGPGYLIVGVHEKKGAFGRFEPMDGDRDALQRRITSIIQDNMIRGHWALVSSSSIWTLEGLLSVLFCPSIDCGPTKTRSPAASICVPAVRTRR